MDSGRGKAAQELLQLALLRLVTLSTPFTHCRTIPLCVLNELSQRYIELLAHAAVEAAQTAKRQGPTAWDVMCAFDEFGVAGMDELAEEATDKLARRDDVDELGYIVKDSTTDAALLLPPTTMITYDQFSQEDLDQIARLSAQTPASTMSPVPSTPPTPLSIHGDDQDDDDDERMSSVEAQPVAGPSNWKDSSRIPSHVPAFFPPFPGEEATADRRRDYRDDSPTAGGPRTWTSSADPWTAPIAFSASMLTTAPSVSRSTRKRSLSPSRVSSREAFEAVADEIAQEGQSYLRPNAKRRLAAASGPSPMTLADSMFGSVPAPTLRGALLTPGFLPEMATTMIHPFNTNLPYTVAHEVPRNPAPHANLAAQSPHPRLPQLLNVIAESLSTPTSPHKMLFTRLTRMGPPGPLGPKGEALDYEYVGNTSLLASTVEWPQRSYDQRLPSRDNAADSSSGIKLKLGQRGSGRAGSSTPAETPGPTTPGGANLVVLRAGSVSAATPAIPEASGGAEQEQEDPMMQDMSNGGAIKLEHVERSLSPTHARNTPQPYPAVL